MANSAKPSGALETDENISAEQLQELRRQIDESWTAPDNKGRVIILQGGLKYKQMSVSPEDAELLASRKFSLEEIARIFAVPPPMIGDLSHGTFTNSREAARWFAQFTLAPWARKIEAVFTEALFPEGSGLSLELDLSGLLRGDPETRWASHKIAVEAGILDANEVREIEGFNPRTAGVA
jgi:HK97 family phage portal protein